MHARMHIHAHAHAHTHTHSQAHARVHTHARTHTHTHKHMHLLCQLNQCKPRQNVHKTCTKSKVQSEIKDWIASYLLIYNPIQYKKPNQCV